MTIFILESKEKDLNRLVHKYEFKPKKSTFYLFLNSTWRFFVPVHYNIENVIKKGGGTRPVETLATL
jgi:hypothetical protein